MIPYGKHHIDEDDIQAVVNVLRTGMLTQGPVVEAFESAIADYVGSKYAVAVSSGTAALHLATLVAGVKPGTSLITSPMTFVASANAALYAGGTPVFTDIDPNTVNMSSDCLVNTIQNTPNVRAIVPVHFAGLPCDMVSIKSAADSIGAVVIEDAAHALGAEYPNGRKVGCCENSLMTIFSFHPVKAMAAGEGGMVTTNDETTYRKLIRLRSHGINKLDDLFQFSEHSNEQGIRDPWYYEMQELGYNFRITDIQCALALSQLKKLDRFVVRRSELVKKYDEAFLDMKNFRPAQVSGRDQSGHHLYVIRIDFDSINFTRGQLMNELKSRGIGSQVHYIPVPSHPYYQNLGFKETDYPNSQKFYQEALSIPLFYELTDEQQAHIITNIKELLS